MEQDLRTCPGCGAAAPGRSPCPYCRWTPDGSEELQIAPAGESPSRSKKSSPPGDVIEEVPLDVDGTQPQDPDMEGRDLPRTAEPPPEQFRELLQSGKEPVHLLEQVPEDMRAILAGRLKASEGADNSSFSENAALSLREQGYTISQDARGVRFAAAPGQSANLSASDMVKMASELEGGVQPRGKLPICSQCQSVSPVGETRCQWCGQPFEQEM